MAGALEHRGPDDEGFYCDDSVGLGSRRLSIIDLEGGAQPIANEDGTIHVVLNGEIYNYRELRKGLQEAGHRFKTRSDTEVLVHLYEEEGLDFPAALRGMFACAIWDSKRRRLVVARDHLGQKPLFYAQDGDSLAFASEIKGLLPVLRKGPELDLSAMHDYLSLRFVPAPRTMLKHVHKLESAHLLVWQNNRVETRRYWSLSFRGKHRLSVESAVEALDERLSDAVKSHTVSDVPVGAHLSGGLDSSMVVAMLAPEHPGLQTFAVGVEGADVNELPFALAVSKRCATNHRSVSVRPHLQDLLARTVWHLDEPSDPIAACMFHAAKLASQHVKVVLGGDGGDEMFGGFDRYLGVQSVAPYHRIPAFLRQFIDGRLAGLSDGFGYKNMTQKLRWVSEVGAEASLAARYARATTFFRFSTPQKRELYTDALGHLTETRSEGVIEEAVEQAEADTPLDRLLHADIVMRLPEHSLALTDRMSMAHSLEQRSPFLDVALVEWTAKLEPDLKVRSRTLKFLLRKLADRYLPREIVRRPKHGFMLPVASWLRDEIEFVRTALLEGFFVREGLFKRNAIEALLAEHAARRRDHHVRLWMLLNLEVWHQLYVDGASVEDVTTSLGAGRER